MQVEAAPTAAIGTDRCDLSQGSGSSLRPSKAVHRNPTWECDWAPRASFPEASECHGRFCPALSVAPTPASMSRPGLRAVASRTTQRHPRPARCPTTCHEAICPRFHKLLRPGFSRAPGPSHIRDLRGTPLRPVGRNAGARRGYTVTALDVASSAHVPPVHASQSAALSARYVHLASSRPPMSFVQHITSRIACQGAPTRPISPAHGSAPAIASVLQHLQRNLRHHLSRRPACQPARLSRVPTSTIAIAPGATRLLRSAQSRFAP